MQNKLLNTIPIQTFIKNVSSADSSNAKEIRIPIKDAKNLAFTLGILMSKLNSDLQEVINKTQTETNTETIQISMDGGSGW